MGEAFFTEVSGADPLRGPRLHRPLAFKVYEPDRLVLGKRMEDHLRIGVCLWHSFAWPGRDMFGIGTLDRPWLEPGRRPDGRRPRRRWPPRSSSSRSSASRTTASTTATSRPRARRFAEFRANLDALADDALGYQERTGVAAAVGHGQPVHPPALPGRRRDQPRPRGLRLRRGPGQAHARGHPAARRRRTTSCGAAARATTRCSTRTSGARATSSPGSCTSSPSTSTRSASRASCSSSPSRWSRPSTSTTTTRRPSTASSSGNGLEGEYQLNIEANHATLAGHSFHHEVAYAVANGILGSIDANRGDPQNGWDTDQFPNSVEDLALPLYEILRGGGFATGGFNFDAKLRRQSTDRTDLFHAHIGGIDTLARALLVAADLLERGDAGATAWTARYAGWDGPLGPAILDGSESLESLEAQGRRRARSTRGRCRAARSSSRTSSTSAIWAGPDR